MNRTIIHTPTNQLQNSLDFYTRLNFEIISEEEPTLVSDGKVIIEINPDRFARSGLKIFKDSWSEEIKQLEKLTEVHNTGKGYMLNDLNGAWIYLAEGDLDTKYLTNDDSFGTTGNFAGLSIESANIERSSDIWNTIGFNTKSGNAAQGWISLKNDNGFSVNLMKPLCCPHLFFNPSMTFFNGEKNLSVIQKIREAGIEISEEVTHFNKEGIVDNIIIRDPGGYGFFIFND